MTLCVQLLCRITLCGLLYCKLCVRCIYIYIYIYIYCILIRILLCVVTFQCDTPVMSAMFVMLVPIN